jgi:SAM-dependent methyltransferase
MNVMAKEHLSIEEIEELGYYDFMGYMEVPFFNVGGAASIDRLAELSHINQDTKILNVGCGTGGNSCYLANRHGCTVVGIDISEHMVAQAKERAESLGLTDRVTFHVADAYDLQFPDASFDAVLTVFVSQFLDPTRAYRARSQQINASSMVEEFGGWGKIVGTLWEIIVIALRSSKIRQRFGKISRGKRVLLRDKEVSKYTSYILCAGRKP